MNEVDLTELNRLEEMLQEAGVPYRRIDDIGEAILGIGYRVGEFHQIKVPSEGWDVICHHGSYGVEQGLLEAMGHKITGNNDVLGYLTAQDVMDRRGGKNADSGSEG